MDALLVAFMSAARSNQDFTKNRSLTSRMEVFIRFLEFCIQSNVACIIISEMHRRPDDVTKIIKILDDNGYVLATEATRNQGNENDFSVAMFVKKTCEYQCIEPIVVSHVGELINRCPRIIISGVQIIGFHGVLDNKSPNVLQSEMDVLRTHIDNGAIVVGDGNLLAEFQYNQPAPNLVGELATFFPFVGDFLPESVRMWFIENKSEDLIDKGENVGRAITQLDVVWCNNPNLSVDVRVLNPLTFTPFETRVQQRKDVLSFTDPTLLASDHFPVFTTINCIN
ncbi:MAG: hypothetical protein EB127_28315 [Alphaproteobacteria bacterium]|nr:hypothetical protein [Alphaproteobacteria bacterium]